MPRQKKYYGTLTAVHYDMLQKIRELGYDDVTDLVINNPLKYAIS